MNEDLRVTIQGSKVKTGKEMFESKNFFEGSVIASMMVDPESPTSTEFRKNMENYPGCFDKKIHKLYYSDPLVCSNDFGQKYYEYETVSTVDGEAPWAQLTESGGIWKHGELQSIEIVASQFPYAMQSNQIPSEIQEKRNEGIKDSINLDYRSLVQTDPNLPERLQSFSTPLVQKSLIIDSAHASGFSKDITGKDVKPEIYLDSSEASDQAEEDEEKGISRSGRRQVSRNLVAERKRRKKLNGQLYSLRSLVPKITKMDRSSILGDAIKYVKDLEEKIEELEKELETMKVDEMDAYPVMALVEDGEKLINEDNGFLRIEKTDFLKESIHIDETRTHEMHSTIQVEVNKMENRVFILRVFCKKKPGVFVKLMQAFDALGLEVLHANITTFQGLVLNVFNAEIQDTNYIEEEQVRKLFLEIAL